MDILINPALYNISIFRIFILPYLPEIRAPVIHRWIENITLPDGTKLVSGHNPEFERHVNINSSKIYWSHASLAFLEYYCDYFSLPLQNKIHATCDNKSYVTKINEFISHPYSKLFIHKIKESEAYLAILSFQSTLSSIT